VILGLLAISGTANAQGGVALEDRLGRRVYLTDGAVGTVRQFNLDLLRRVDITKGYRATLCESGELRARCRRLVGANSDQPTTFTPPFSAAGTVVKVEKALFGFADLHVHPAAHLAWGARGAYGILWGRPGMAYETDSVATDLAACPTARDPWTGKLSASIHSVSSNPFTIAARFGLLMSRDSNHGPIGHPMYLDWPRASSIVHQQMHVTMLKRAWEGGLRLIVASATDNQMLDILWNPEFSLSQGRFAFREDADYKSAQEQFEFIQQFVAANASWMAIAKTPSQARTAINQGKLALVLGLEMDELSAEEILKLKEQYGVALVMPVHLINNSFGGTAVYNDFFNIANYLMNGELYRIDHDPTVGFQLDLIQGVRAVNSFVNNVLKDIPVIKDLVANVPMPREYLEKPNEGHINKFGILDEYGMKRLMKAGLLIDTAHMSSRATDATLTLAGKIGYPVVYSHGGKRWGSKASERGLNDAQFQRVVDSGGILGLGTGSSKEEPTSMAKWLDYYLEVAKVGPVALGSDLNGMAEQVDIVESPLNYPTEAIRNADWSTTRRTQSLPMFQLGMKQFDIRRDGVAHIGMLPDFLAVVRERTRYASTNAERNEGVRLVDQVFHSAHDFIATWEKASLAASSVNTDLPAAPINQVKLTLETGTDNLKCGGVMVSAMKRVDGQDRQVSIPAMINRGLGANSTYVMSLNMFPDIQVRDIDKIRFDYIPNKCDVFDTGDTWNIKTLKVTYAVVTDGRLEPGVLMHKRGAPARRLDRGATWTVYTER
jgi:microsomal dipeptidase-like Zn-dependent dipeptidase